MAELLKKFKILEPVNPNRSTGIVNGKASGILNWNDIAYPHFYELYKSLLANFWVADSINMSNDKKQFIELTPKEQDAYLKIIGLLATFDAPQTRYMLQVTNYLTDPSVYSVTSVIAQQEAEHNRSYSYELASVVPSQVQKKAFELGREDEVVIRRNKEVMDSYNAFLENPTLEGLIETMVYSSVLEGLFFYSGFAFFYNLARNQKMVGTSTMISYINRDELVHGKAMADFLRAILHENPEYNTPELAEKVYGIFDRAVAAETEWSKYVLTGIDGIDLIEMEGYIKYRANKMLRMIGLSELYEDFTENPMPWIRAYVDNFNGVKTDFFEQHSRQYAKPNEDNGFDDL